MNWWKKYLSAEDNQSHDGHHSEDERDLAVGLEPLAETDEDRHPDDDHVEQCLEESHLLGNNS